MPKRSKKEPAPKRGGRPRQSEKRQVPRRKRSATALRPIASAVGKVEPQVRGEKIFCPLLGEWRQCRPEEMVRQRFVLHLHHAYGYHFDQMAQEQRVQAGTRSPRADIVIWRSAAERRDRRSPGIVVECKAETVAIRPIDYYQGESYSRAVGAEYLVAHNGRFTEFFRIQAGLPGELIGVAAIPKANDWEDAARMEVLKRATRAFDRREFQDLLHRCHGILRDNHKMEPGRAFDTISKVLFIKMYIERAGEWGTFTKEYLAQQRRPSERALHEVLFDETREFFKADEIFTSGDSLDVSATTFNRLVGELERFNLSATGEDVKGLAFERFLGETFRGNLGQFFTPRPVVNFMVDLLDPREGELVCDPAAGSGGFLIRAFEHVRAGIEADITSQKMEARAIIEARRLPAAKEENEIAKRFAALNESLDVERADPPSRVWSLAHRSIFGTDAEPRAARTAKMNMIMHGDGHGGIHYHDGLLDVGGIFEGRFDVVLSNPPFGSNVGKDQRVDGSEQTRVSTAKDYIERNLMLYGQPWAESHARMAAAAKGRTSLLELFEIGRGKANRSTEDLFVERCVRLLKRGGRVGIILPTGNLTNASHDWFRRWTEGKAWINALVSLPPETFAGADATVTACIVVLTRFTMADEEKWNNAWVRACEEVDARFVSARAALARKYEAAICTGLSQRVADAIVRAKTSGLAPTELQVLTEEDGSSLVRGAVQSRVQKSVWRLAAGDRKAQAAARQRIDSAWDKKAREQSLTALRSLRSACRQLDDEQRAERWLAVRRLFDYPVFTSAPQAVGITASGAEGPNDLPAVLKAYKSFAAWVASGADATTMPQFDAS